jgi:hypothetical protein
VTRRPTLARVRRFYWLWGVALPLLVGLGAYGFTPDLAENALASRVQRRRTVPHPSV